MTESDIIQSLKRPTRVVALIEAQTQRAIARIAESDCPVLIAGEHGVGKRAIASQIHTQSRRSRNPFTEIHCQSASRESIISALSENGSIYLVEIGELSLPLQELIIATYFRSEQACSSRLLCSASHELPAEVKSWRMREDFFHLISTVTLRISPLRCRRSEILAIVDELLTQYSKQFDRPKPILGKEIIDFLMEHPWPGNLTELETAIKTFVAIGDQSISLAAFKAAAPTIYTDGHHKPLSLKEATKAASIQIERQLISEVLITTGGNRKRAADELGISYKALLYKLKQVATEYQPLPISHGITVN